MLNVSDISDVTIKNVVNICVALYEVYEGIGTKLVGFPIDSRIVRLVFLSSMF